MLRLPSRGPFDTQPVLMDHTYKPDFVYKHDNPYHDRLGEFPDFVLRDSQGEAFRGKWNSDFFKREAPLYLEIGTGFGDFMMEFCHNHPNVNFVGLDYRFKRSYQVAKKLSRFDIENFCYLRARGERIAHTFAENELDGIFFFFSDPWPKQRHHKRRLFQKEFLNSAFTILKPGAKIYIKTDHDGYAEWMENLLQNQVQDQGQFAIEFQTKNLIYNMSGANIASVPFLSTFQTKFEKIFVSQGTKIKAFELTSTKNAMPIVGRGQVQ